MFRAEFVCPIFINHLIENEKKELSCVVNYSNICINWRLAVPSRILLKARPQFQNEFV